MRRISIHPILNFPPKNKVKFLFEGKELEGYEGEPIAAALVANGFFKMRESANLHRPRGFFCAIGNCSSCLMVVDGKPNIRTCITPLKEGMKVEIQKDKGVIR
ncbi:MAG: (2Fe-2S)-binding protein [Caldiserica bacterium]|jgi:predicted molibdopterin-dependent oxidoreductase YjgC|nr:(2Fe-2S)-binding protein [Caldisericota bacterium]MDH7561989.1 (2Fe-2S)-binding protein [Caldisericota bacterium]